VHDGADVCDGKHIVLLGVADGITSCIVDGDEEGDGKHIVLLAEGDGKHIELLADADADGVVDGITS